MQVLLGLQSNALKHTDEGQIQVNVKIVTMQNDQYLHIEVIDTGFGIPKEDQNKLFKLFGFVNHTSNKNTNGVGLGLVIANLIVDKFDGTINFESTVGVGSNFYFTFKLVSKSISSA